MFNKKQKQAPPPADKPADKPAPNNDFANAPPPAKKRGLFGMGKSAAPPDRSGQSRSGQSGFSESRPRESRHEQDSYEEDYPQSRSYRSRRSPSRRSHSGQARSEQSRSDQPRSGQSGSRQGGSKAPPRPSLFGGKPKPPKEPEYKLIACCECGQMVSPEATVCPHCNGSPYPQRCCICCQTDKQSLLQTPVVVRPPDAAPLNRREEMRRRPPTLTFYRHAACRDHVEHTPQPFQCVACKHKTDYLLLGSRPPNCPKCGHAVPVTTCWACGLPIVMGKAQEWHVGYRVDREVGSVEDYFHPECRVGIEARKKEVLADRRKRAVCYLCGGRMEFLESLMKHHADCHVFRFDTKYPSLMRPRNEPTDKDKDKEDVQR